MEKRNLEAGERVLAIPDVHLKPWIFDRAEAVMKEYPADRAVFLGDSVDDWGQEFNLELYRDTLDRMIRFAGDHPETIFLWGNHECSYLWGRMESGYSAPAKYLIRKKLAELQEVISPGRIWFVYRNGQVIFSHGGLSQDYVQHQVEPDLWDDPDQVIERINSFGAGRLWKMDSPIWFRPDMGMSGVARPLCMYGGNSFLHCVGHTPVRENRQDHNLLCVDSFSTYSGPEHDPIGSQKFVIIRTAEKTWIEAG